MRLKAMYHRRARANQNSVGTKNGPFCGAKKNKAALSVLFAIAASFIAQASPHAADPQASLVPVEAKSANSRASLDTKSAPIFKVGSSGGAYMQSQKIAYFTPFSVRTGMTVQGIKAANILARLSLQAKSSKSDWDVVDVSAAALEEGCRKGLLAQLDTQAIVGAPYLRPVKQPDPNQPDQRTKSKRKKNKITKPKSDFLPGSLHKCGIASMAWSSVIVVDKRQFRKKRRPRTLADFFNTRRFSGRRALPKGPEYTLEVALMADGVPASKVYAALETKKGVKRAFKKLNRIKNRVVWWEKGSTPLKKLAEKKVSMALAFNGRAFQAAMRHPGRYNLIWSGQIYDFGYWAIPKRSAHHSQAISFIKFAMSPAHQAHQSRLFPYGPTRRSAVEAIGNHATLGVAMLQYIPTRERHLRGALHRQEIWWKANKTRLAKHFDDWRAGRPLFPAPKPEPALVPAPQKAADASEKNKPSATEAAEKQGNGNKNPAVKSPASGN